VELRRWLAWDWLPVLLIALATFAYLSFAQDLFSDGDTSWHLAAGKLIMVTASVPTSDPFSFTFRGSPWIAHEWLAEVLMAGSFRMASWAGLGLLTALAVAILVVIVGAELRRWLEPRHVAASLAALFIVLAPAILARPHVLAWPVLAGWTIVLLRAREAGRTPPLAASLLMLFWANLHGSFLFGLLLIGVFGLEALLQEKDRKRVLLGWGLFGCAALLLSMVTPAGFEGLLFPLQVSSMEALDLIEEWRPSSPSRDPLFFAVVGGGLLLLLFKRPRLSLPRLILLAALAYLALTHARHQALLAIVGLLVVAPSLSGKSIQGPDAKSGHDGYRAVLLLGSGIVLFSLLRLIVPVSVQDTGTNPRAAIAAVPPSLRSQPVFNSYSFGGPLILNNIAPFIDGRADMYGDSFTFESRAIEGGDASAFRRAVVHWGIRWTILYPKTRLVAVLDRDPEWRRIYADKWAVIHVRTVPGEKTQWITTPPPE
jgi:hypothetical protein